MILCFSAWEKQFWKGQLTTGWLAAHGFLNVFYILMWRQSRLVINLFDKMVEFVLSEAEVENSVCDMSIVSEERESNREFIDDAEYDENESEEVIVDDFKNWEKKLTSLKKLWEIIMGTTTLILFFQFCMQFVFN